MFDNVNKRKKNKNLLKTKILSKKKNRNKDRENDARIDRFIETCIDVKISNFVDLIDLKTNKKYKIMRV